MALKQIISDYYIKIDLAGNFKVYKNKKARDQEKKTASFKDICSKYQLILTSLRQDTERRYYDPEFVQLIAAWQKEYSKYLSCHSQGLRETAFPLMKQYIKNIEKSLPEVICSGAVGVKGNTLEEVYDYVKQKGYFGEVEDC